MEGRLYISANCVAFTCVASLFPVLPLLPSCIHTMLIEGGCIIGRSTFRELLPSPLSTLKPYRELRCPMSNQIVLHRLLPAWLNTPPRLHLCLIRCVRCGRCIGMEGRLYMSANCVAFTSCCLFSRSSSHYFPHAFTMLIEGGCIIVKAQVLPT